MTDKNVLITGAAQRIGRTIAMDMATAGWAVAIHYNSSEEAAQDVVREISNTGGKAVALQADLSQEEETSTLVSRASDAIGPLTCLVNNASLFEHDAPATVTRESWDTHMQINLRAPFILSQAFAERVPNTKSCNIINIIDQRVWNLTPDFTSYTLSKAGLWTLTQTLAMALAPGIRVNAIGPGPTLQSKSQSPDDFSQECAETLLKQQVTTDEIGRTVRFILDAPSLTGQMIAIDGGQHLGTVKSN
jgi:NAD(P)-dependent dehydrogenase (short-subunit alcohol dehydrogenase family)